MGDLITTKELIVLLSIFAVFAVIATVIVLKQQSDKRRGKVKSKKKKQSAIDDFMLRAYIKLDKFFLTGDTVRKVTKQVQSMSVYSLRDAYILTAKYVISSLGVAIVFMFIAVIFFDDAISILLCMIFGLVFASNMVDKKVDKINILVYNQLRFALSSIREKFLEKNSVAEAIQEAEYGRELKNCFEDIHNILTTSNAELKLKEFFEKVPFRHIQTLARVCYDINNTGDELDEYGNSNFLQAMSTMTTDVTNELSRMEYQKLRFGPIEYLALIPIVGIKIIEMFFVGIMPGTAVIYDGASGYVVRIATIAVSIIIYTVIAKINTTQSIKEDDRIFVFNKLLKDVKPLRVFVYNICPKNTAKKAARRKVEDKLKTALSKKRVEELYLEKVAYGIVAFIISLFAIVCAVQMGKQHMLNSVQSLSLVDMESSVQIPKDKLIEMDNEYMRLKKEGKAPTGEDEYQFVASRCTGLSDMEIQDQQKRMVMKATTIENAYFHWYFLLICFGVSLAAFRLPDMLLKLRQWLVNVEAEEDFLQLQTLMSILMKTDCDTLDALEQMSQVAKIHKDMLLYCYHSYPANPDKELARLESRTPLMEFKRFIGKMRLTTYDLSLRDVFSDLNLEREYIQEQRDLKMRDTIDKKRNKCGMLSKVPMWMMVIGEFIYPIAYLGATELMSAISSMQSL